MKSILKSIYKTILPMKTRKKIWIYFNKFHFKQDMPIFKLVYMFGERGLFKTIFKKKNVFFYPDIPNDGHYAIKKMCFLLGYKMTNNVKKKKDIIFHWKDCTLREKDEVISKLAQDNFVINLNFNDISKNYVDDVFKEVFGYSTMVDPLTHNGKCVKKSDDNSKHDGVIIDCPITEVDNNYIYQKVINNEIENNFVQDIRIMIFGDKIPFAYTKNRHLSQRFSYPIDAKIVKVADVFSGQELENILRFCKKMSIDYGELDILRDKDDGKIYIVDANNTPWGPPSCISKKDGWRALKIMAKTFEEYLDAR